jgi:hypothetical protein
MAGGAPRPILPVATFFATQEGDRAEAVDLAALRAYLEQTTLDDPVRKLIHLTIAGWDGADRTPWVKETAAHAPPRRALVYELLEIDASTTAAFDGLFPLTGDGSVIISQDFEPWYTEERRRLGEFYWRAYERHLVDAGWNPDDVSKLDAATSKVVERLSDPARIEAFAARGLVVGYVQSGKTANFTGVIAKAVDAGYRLVIVLTGTVDILRKQTQRRIDMELVGVENIFRGIDPDDPDRVDDVRHVDYFLDEDRLKGRFLRHSFLPSEKGFPDIVRLTLHGSDYKSLNAGITALELTKADRSKPLFDRTNLYATDARLAVVKKNGPVLRKLVRDLRSIKSHLPEIPTLIIDDESDQASLNTVDPKKWKQGQPERTAINGLISQLLGLLPRAQYVGYTATPYANVFVDPSDTEDIFPKDFLLSLERPDGYMGVSDFHDLTASPDDKLTVTTSNRAAFVRDLRAEKGGTAERSELRKALDAFLLSGALKLYRREQSDGARLFRHHTMLVHESVSIAAHREMAELVRDVWQTAGYADPSGADRLADLLESDFRPVHDARAPQLAFPNSFDELRPYVASCRGEILSSDGNPVLVVNGDKDIEQQQLDFDAQPIWRILIGGAKLSRGFTIEGLTTSYYRRRTKQADTLMQMGRWFGFRRGYNDLVRLFIGREEPDGRSIPFDLYEAFEGVVRDEEAFREQLRQYSELVDGRPQIIPRDIPPLVTQHLVTVTPSARNKMFNAEMVIRRTPGEANEPTAYPTDVIDIEHNYWTMAPLLSAAHEPQTLSFPAEPRGDKPDRPAGRYEAKVGFVSATDVVHAIGSCRWLTADYFSPDLAYLDEICGEVKVWVLIAPQTAATPPSLKGVGARSVFVRRRRQGRGGLFGAISDPKHRPPAARVAHARAGWGDAAVEQLATPERGAVLLYPIVESETRTSPRDVVIAFTIFAPASARPTTGQLIQFQAKDKGSPLSPIVEVSD